MINFNLTSQGVVVVGDSKLLIQTQILLTLDIFGNSRKILGVYKAILPLDIYIIFTVLVFRFEGIFSTHTLLPKFMWIPVIESIFALLTFVQ